MNFVLELYDRSVIFFGKKESGERLDVFDGKIEPKVYQIRQHFIR